jgi:hypothetical protein
MADSISVIKPISVKSAGGVALTVLGKLVEQPPAKTQISPLRKSELIFWANTEAAYHPDRE